MVLFEYVRFKECDCFILDIIMKCKVMQKDVDFLYKFMSVLMQKYKIR